MEVHVVVDDNHAADKGQGRGLLGDPCSLIEYINPYIHEYKSMSPLIWLYTSCSKIFHLLAYIFLQISKFTKFINV